MMHTLTFPTHQLQIIKVIVSTINSLTLEHDNHSSFNWFGQVCFGLFRYGLIHTVKSFGRGPKKSLPLDDAHINIPTESNFIN
jgi:hypothetical protein